MRGSTVHDLTSTLAHALVLPRFPTRHLQGEYKPCSRLAILSYKLLVEAKPKANITWSEWFVVYS